MHVAAADRAGSSASDPAGGSEAGPGDGSHLLLHASLFARLCFAVQVDLRPGGAVCVPGRNRGDDESGLAPLPLRFQVVRLALRGAMLSADCGQHVQAPEEKLRFGGGGCGKGVATPARMVSN